MDCRASSRTSFGHLSAAEIYEEGRAVRTKYNFRNTPERIEITRRHHPLQGQQFEVLKDGKKRILIRTGDGMSMYIPREWTDADGAKPEEHHKHDGYFTVESLRRLLELVEMYLSR
jgi:hypothetical protein